MTATGSERGHPRRVRSFVRRGRLTDAQANALAALWPRYGVSLEVARNPGYWESAFAQTGPLTLEVGFGMGRSLLAMAAADPERRFIGVEVHEPGVGSLLAGIEALGLDNIRVIAADVVEVLAVALGPRELDAVQIFFPDPWPKRRHHKRRLIQPEFVARLAGRVREGGTLMLATDWDVYARHMRAVLDAAPEWENQAGAEGYVPRPAARPETRFETRGLSRGHAVFDLLYRRTAAEEVAEPPGSIGKTR